MSDSLSAAFAAAYPELLRMAHARLRREPSPISTLTLAHELYLGLQHRKDLQFASKGQFLAYAGHAMRSLLVDLARARMAAKRQAELLPLTLGDDVADLQVGQPEQYLALEQAFDRLGRLEPRLLQVAELRAVLGMELVDIAQALNVSEPTVKRDWQRARAFLHDILGVAP